MKHILLAFVMLGLQIDGHGHNLEQRVLIRSLRHQASLQTKHHKCQ